MSVKLPNKNVITEYDYKADELHVTGMAAGEVKARVSFLAKDSDGSIIDAKYVDLSGEDWIKFYANWDGPFAMRRVYGLLDPSVDPTKLPASIEQEVSAGILPSSFEKELIPEVISGFTGHEAISPEEVAIESKTEPDKEITVAKSDGTSLLVKLSGALAALAAAGTGAYMYFK